MVFLAKPVMRTVARIELPSTSARMICARSARLNLFILTIMHDRSRFVKWVMQASPYECLQNRGRAWIMQASEAKE